MEAIEHTWRPHHGNPNYQVLNNATHSLVRTIPMPDGRYLWQFRKVCGRAVSIEAAKECVEAGYEFFRVFRRNPWA